MNFMEYLGWCFVGIIGAVALCLLIAGCIASVRFLI